MYVKSIYVHEYHVLQPQRLKTSTKTDIRKDVDFLDKLIAYEGKRS